MPDRPQRARVFMDYIALHAFILHGAILPRQR
jgi:hypothetical protein